MPLAERTGNKLTKPSDVLRTHEMQVWFLAEHLVDTPLVQAE
jgi:hypothetical protein